MAAWSTQLATMTGDTVLTRWPKTVDIFNRYNMACVGCSVALFYTIGEAAMVYHLSVYEFVVVLKRAFKEESDN